MENIGRAPTPTLGRSACLAQAERRRRPSLIAATLIVCASVSMGIAGSVLSTTSPAHALATYGPITSITLSNSTVSESGAAYQLTAAQVSNATNSTDLTAT